MIALRAARSGLRAPGAGRDRRRPARARLAASAQARRALPTACSGQGPKWWVSWTVTSKRPGIIAGGAQALDLGKEGHGVRALAPASGARQGRPRPLRPASRPAAGDSRERSPGRGRAPRRLAQDPAFKPAIGAVGAENGVGEGAGQAVIARLQAAKGVRVDGRGVADQGQVAARGRTSDPGFASTAMPFSPP
jgi:hypothetical protein